MSARGPGRAVVLGLLLGASTPSLARADDETDGAYGRLDGDLLLVAGAGVGVEAGGPQLALHGGVSYLSTAGLYVRYADALGHDEARFARSLAAGLELRPLFLGRYALDLERGPAHLDLFVDSLSLGVGAVWSSPGDLGMQPEPGLELALGLEVPLLPRASGPYLGVTGVMRFPHSDLLGDTDRSALDRGAMLLFSFSWHQVVDAGLVDAHRGPKDR